MGFRVRKKLAEGGGICSDREKEVCRGHSRRESAEGPNGPPARGVTERGSRLSRNGGGVSVGRKPIRDENPVGEMKADAPVEAQRLHLLLRVDSIYRTAVYVTRSYGGVGGGSRKASPYPEWANLAVTRSLTGC